MDLHLSLEKKIIKKSLKTAEISSFEVMFRNVIQVYNFTSLHFKIMSRIVEKVFPGHFGDIKTTFGTF